MAANNRDGIQAYPIRTVSALTGINSVTLRTWERRYNLLEPSRTPKGHRLYTKDQIGMLHKVKALVERGIPISQINFHEISGDQLSRASQEADFWQRLIERMVIAVSHFDEPTLENTYNEALSLYSIEHVTEHLLMPMLTRLGERWELGEGTVAEEHFFGVYLRNKLGARFHHRKRHEHGPSLLTACLPGERHEAGILLFALSAYEHGYRCILLGVDMPLQELARAVKQSKSQGIVLSASFSPDVDALSQELHALVNKVSVPVFVGGQTSVVHKDAIRQAGAIPLGTDIQLSFSHIAEAFKKQFAASLRLPA